MIDVRLYGAKADGTTDCSTAINQAILVDDIILQNGVFLISESIKIPSNRTVYGKNAKLKLADGAYDNFFRNSDFVNGNTNIKITGLGNFVLDGNTWNNIEVYPFGGVLDYTTYGYNGEESYKYQGTVFKYVDTLEVTGIIMSDRPHVALSNVHNSNVTYKDIYLDYKVLTRNQDGITIGWGSHDFVIDNIRGYCGDDVIAFNAGDRGGFMPVELYHSDYTTGDIYNIDIDNVNLFFGAANFYIIICGDGNKVYNISFDDVSINYCRKIFYSGYTNFRTIAPAKEDIQDITMDNILVKSMDESIGVGFDIGENCQDFTITNFTNNSGMPDFDSTEGLDIVNFTINSISYPAA